MTAWPDNKLNRTAPNSNYTCKSHGNTFGAGVSSTIEIAVDCKFVKLLITFYYYIDI